jgi:hypothetical protein
MKSFRKTPEYAFLMREFQAIGSVWTRISIDTIELFFRIPPEDLRTRLQAAHDERIQIEDCVDRRTGEVWGVRAIINRPNRRVIMIACELLQANKSARLSRVDIAVDFQTSSEESARTLLKLLDRHVVLKWRSRRATKDSVDTTVYWGKGGRNRNLVLYVKKFETIRLELRFHGSQVVRRAGLANPARLLGLNPRSKLEHNITLASLTDRFIQKAVRRAVSKDRVRHMKERPVRRRTSRVELFYDRYRSNIARRVESGLRRIDMQRLSSATRARGSQKVPLGHLLSIPEFLSWPDPSENHHAPSVINSQIHPFS